MAKTGYFRWEAKSGLSSGNLRPIEQLEGWVLRVKLTH